MKQLYYTSCRLGHSINGQSGFQVRAASPGLDQSKLRAASAYVAYKPPDSLPRTEEAVATAPVRLALLDTPDLGRILLHSVYVGREGEGTRGGNFFSHLLFDGHRTVGAVEAIRLWGSDFWQGKDGNFDKVLPDAALPTNGPSADLDPTRLLETKRGQEMLRFLLTALLLPQHGSRRIVLAASAQEVACCVYAATSVLPLGMTRELTFSTYEYAPLTSRAKIIGADPVADLPSACFSDSCVGFHYKSGRTSNLGGAPYFADKAVGLLASGKLSNLMGFAAWCEERQIHHVALLDLAFRFKHVKDFTPNPEEVRLAIEHGPLGKEVLQRPSVLAVLTQKDCQLALRNPDLTEVLCAQPIALQKIVTWSLNDASFHLESLPALVAALDAADEPLRERQDLSQELQDRLGGWVFLYQLEQEPSLMETHLDRAGQVLSGVPGEAREQRVEHLTAVLAAHLCAQPRLNPQATLEAIVWCLARDAPEKVYTRLCEHFTARAGDGLPTNLVLALVAVGFGQCKSPDLAEALGAEAVKSVEAFIRELKVRKQRLLRLAIRNEARDWPRNVRERVRRLIPLPFWTSLRRHLRTCWVRYLILVIVVVLALILYFVVPGLFNSKPSASS